MDIPNSKPSNFLYISPENKDDIQEIVKIATILIKQNKKVLLFTRKHFDFMSALTGLTKEQMQQFIISYHSDISTVIGKLLELHDWTILPDFVVLNLNSFYNSPDSADAIPIDEPEFDEVCFCIAALLHYMRFLQMKGCARSVVLLNAHHNVKVQLLIDFYFYKMAALNVMDEVQSKVLDM